MSAKLLLLFVCGSVFFFDPLFGLARQATPAKTQPGKSAVSIPSAQAFSARSSTRSFSTNSDQKVLKDFQEWVVNYATVAPAEKTRLITNGLNLAAERRKILAGLIESD